MTRHADGKYNYRAWDQVNVPVQAAFPPQEYLGPFQSNSERLVSQAMAVHNMSSEEIQEFVRPNIPQIDMFPDRYGYTTEEYGIKDIIELKGRPNQRHDYSGEPTTQESTSRNTLGGSI
jgi:hypothetical protein